MEHPEAFNENIAKRFPISKTVMDGQIKFNGAFIQQDSQGSITLSIDGYMHAIEHMHVDKARSKSGQSRATTREVAAIRAVAGELVWLGGGALPQAAYVGSYMQQCVPYLKIDHIVQANGMLKELKDLKAEILYKNLWVDIAEATIESFSDAAFNISRAKQYGKTGLIVGIRYMMKGRTEAMYHVVYWASRKQRRVCHSSYGAEILACADADDRGYNLKLAMTSLFQPKRSDMYSKWTPKVYTTPSPPSTRVGTTVCDKPYSEFEIRSKLGKLTLYDGYKARPMSRMR